MNEWKKEERKKNKGWIDGVLEPSSSCCYMDSLTQSFPWSFVVTKVDGC